MRSCVVTESGTVVDCVILRRFTENLEHPSEAEVELDDLRYVIRTGVAPQRDQVAHYQDLVPLGLYSPSEVFSVEGRHLNFGISQGGCGEDGRFLISQYPSGGPLGNYGIAKEVAFSTILAKPTGIVRPGVLQPSGPLRPLAQSRRQSGVRIAALGELQIPPMLSSSAPTPPLRVGSKVVARRFGCSDRLHSGTVTKCFYDCSYAIQYDDDNHIDMRVIHNDVLLQSWADAEPCTVRDRVAITVQHRTEDAIIVESMGNAQYRVSLIERLSDPPLVVPLSAIVLVAPLLTDALYSTSEEIVNLFRSMDVTLRAGVFWKDLRAYLLDREDFGQPLTYQQLGYIQRDLCLGKGIPCKGLLGKVPIHNDDMVLSFADFEYVVRRAMNMI
jgi:hypothetical protein